MCECCVAISAVLLVPATEPPLTMGAPPVTKFRSPPTLPPLRVIAPGALRSDMIEVIDELTPVTAVIAPLLRTTWPPDAKAESDTLLGRDLQVKSMVIPRLAELVEPCRPEALTTISLPQEAIAIATEERPLASSLIE